MRYIIRVKWTVLLLLMFTFSQAQIDFLLTAGPVCEKDTVNLTANLNAYPATSIAWMAQPSGAVFSAPTSSITNLNFSSGGTYTITLMASVGNSTAYATHTILVHPNPLLQISASTTTLCSGQDATLIATGADTYTWVQSLGLVSSYNGTAYISPSSTNVYSVSGSNGFGCVTESTIEIVYSSFPYLTTISTASAVCSGYQATLTAFGANSYTWMSSQFLNPVMQQTVAVGPGSFTLLGTNGGTCRDSITLSIGQLPDLDLTIQSDRTLICKDGGDTLVPIVLTASGAINYEWQPYQPGRMTYSAGAVTAVSPSVSTCYTLTGSSPNCQAKKSLCIQVTTCGDINELNTNKNIIYFPNPVKDILTLVSESDEFAEIWISDRFGKIVLRKDINFSDNPVRVDVSELSIGVYFLRILYRSEGSTIIKLIKE